MSGTLQATAASAAVAVSAVEHAPIPARPGAVLAALLAAPDAAEIAVEGVRLALDAEKLNVYALALELQIMANTLVPSVNRVLRDQFERASLSIVLNLAEAMCSQCLQENRTF